MSGDEDRRSVQSESSRGKSAPVDLTLFCRSGTAGLASCHSDMTVNHLKSDVSTVLLKLLNSRNCGLDRHEKTYVIKSNRLKRSTPSTRIPRMEAFWAMSSRTSAILFVNHDWIWSRRMLFLSHFLAFPLNFRHFRLCHSDRTSFESESFKIRRSTG